MEKNNINTGAALRLKEMMKVLDIKAVDIAKSTGMSSGYISNVLSGKKSIGVEMAYSLWETYKVNVHWLLTGEGLMKVVESVAKEPEGKYESNNEVLILQARLEECRELVTRLSGNVTAANVLINKTERIPL